MLNDFGYLEKIEANLRRVKEEQAANIQAAGKLMADAVEQDRLISVYGGGGHTTLVMGEMFFRAGGLANINPVMETGLSVFNQALKYLELERTENYGSAIVRYYDLQPGDLLIIFHNIGINAATIAHWLEIECVRQCVERGLTPPVWRSANAPGGDEYNAANLKKYRPLVKNL